jgi:hypothetical protein
MDLRNLLIFGATALVVQPWMAIAGSPSSADQERAKQQMKTELGAPERGTAADVAGQVTIGGSKYSVPGEILKIEGPYYYVKDLESGEPVRLIVNKDTNLDCGTRQGSMASERKQQDTKGTTERQQAQGQKRDETAVGSGFKIGDCDVKPGNIIKADVSDLGTVTTLRLITDEKEIKQFSAMTPRAMGEAAQVGELAIPYRQDKPGQLELAGAGGEYIVLPVPAGKLRETEGRFADTPIKNPNGKILGTLYRLITDAGTGKIEYAIVKLADTNMLVPVPWEDFKIKKDERSLIFQSRQVELKPELTAKESQDRSPKLKDIDRIVKDMQGAIAPADLRGGQGGMVGSSKAEPQPQIACTKCEVLRGAVLNIDKDSLVVRDQAGKEVRLYIDANTQMGQQDPRYQTFKQGDQISAYVTPEGHAQSITLLRPASGLPGGEF